MVVEIANSYMLKYMKIYFWQFVSLITNLGSMFIVLPFLTSNPVVYGIYAICISVTIFFSYADLGFIYAGQKYAAEYYIKNDDVNEKKIIGFSIFILTIVISIFSLFILFFYYNPGFIIKDISNNIENLNIAKNLFLFFFYSCFLTILQRTTQLIFSIRLEEYILQRFNIFGNILRLLSIFWFFREGSYELIQYFAFFQLINSLIIVICFYTIKKRYNYSLRDLFKEIKFDKDQFNISRYLAFSGLYIMIIWILYYELDQIIIGKYFGPYYVSIFAIGFSLLSFIRGLLGILYSPFNHRFNYFTGLNDFSGLKYFYKDLVIYLSPLIIGFIFSFYLFTEHIIISWVGIEFKASISIAKFLILCNLYAFISYPTSMLLKSLVRLREFNIFNFFIPFVFYLIIYVSIDHYGIVSFAFSKFIVFSILALFYLVFFLKYLQINFFKFILRLIKTNIISLGFLSLFFILLKDFLPYSKSSLNLFIVLFSIFLGMIFYYLIVLICNKSVRLFYLSKLKIISKKFFK